MYSLIHRKKCLLHQWSYLYTKGDILNYLAHFYLASEDEGLIIGNIMADYKKGRQYLELPKDVQRGVLLHRSIDDFTDNHPEVEKRAPSLQEFHKSQNRPR